MARTRIAERTLQAQDLSSFGALACPADSRREGTNQPTRRELADASRPVVRW